jgi:hypothetical protein
MKRKLLVILTAVLLPLSVLGQSSMTDDQVMNFIAKEYKAGNSRGQIVTKLIQNGVDISQIRRVQKKYERIAQDKGLGAVSDASIGKTNDDRTRTNNVQKETEEGSSQRIGNSGYNPELYTFDENDKEFTEMQGAMDDLLPTDTATMYKRLLEQQKRNKKKVWGRDIFNNKNLSFAPAMNIATPRDYVLGPGDAVFIDVYGASQKNRSGRCVARRNGDHRRLRTRPGGRTDRFASQRPTAFDTRSTIQQQPHTPECRSDTQRDGKRIWRSERTRHLYALRLLHPTQRALYGRRHQ